MQTDLTKTIPYYIYSHLQELQDLEDELTALYSAKDNATMAGAMPEDIYEFEYQIKCTQERIAYVKAQSN